MELLNLVSERGAKEVRGTPKVTTGEGTDDKLRIQFGPNYRTSLACSRFVPACFLVKKCLKVK